MMELRPGDQRGIGKFDWLHSKHSFSFGNYYDEAHMGFSVLRVINDDQVIPEAGFATHGHRDMEIISYVLEGEIAHKDSEGNVTRLPAGEFQLMSAGSGIRHSEYNPSASKKLHFLQVWIQPNVLGEKPGYQQKDFGQAPGLTLVASPDGEAGSLLLKQDARVFQLVLAPGGEALFAADPARHYYVYQVDGSLNVREQQGDSQGLQAGDGLKIRNSRGLVFAASQEPVKALVFDLP